MLLLNQVRPNEVHKGEAQKKNAVMAQVVEHVLGKDEVVSSNLIISSMKKAPNRVPFLLYPVCFTVDSAPAGSSAVPIDKERTRRSGFLFVLNRDYSTEMRK